jgi:transketolase
MRNAFISRLTQLAEANPELVLVTGDLGFGVFDEFKARYPDQFLNAGVAEQNMTAVATGMAMEGLTTFTYSIGNFPTLRNDTFYHDANVTVVSVGGGYSYGQLGMSHHATEDLSILRALPGVTICAPASRWETVKAVDALIEAPGAGYLRLERAGTFEDDGGPPFELGKARELRSGDAMTLIGIGGVMSEVVAAADALAADGISCRVLSMHTLRPFDADAVVAAAGETGGIVTVEENTVLGGLGGAVAEVCLEADTRPRAFKRLGIADRFTSAVGDQQYLRELAGIDRVSIARQVRSLVQAA